MTGADLDAAITRRGTMVQHEDVAASEREAAYQAAALASKASDLTPGELTARAFELAAEARETEIAPIASWSDRRTGEWAADRGPRPEQRLAAALDRLLAAHPGHSPQSQTVNLDAHGRRLAEPERLATGAWIAREAHRIANARGSEIDRVWIARQIGLYTRQRQPPPVRTGGW